MISKFFIERPVLANVIAILMILLGAVAVYGLPVAYAMFKICDKVVGVRSKPEDERTGLDRAEHGLEAYPAEGGL